MRGVETLDSTLGKMKAFGVEVGLEADEEAFGGEDAEDVVLDDLAVVFVGHDAVLDAAGDDVGGAVGEVFEGLFHVLGEDGGLGDGIGSGVLFLGGLDGDGELVGIEGLDTDVGGGKTGGGNHPTVVVHAGSEFDHGATFEVWNDFGSGYGFEQDGFVETAGEEATGCGKPDSLRAGGVEAFLPLVDFSKGVVEGFERFAVCEVGLVAQDFFERGEVRKGFARIEIGNFQEVLAFGEVHEGR